MKFNFLKSLFVFIFIVISLFSCEDPSNSKTKINSDWKFKRLQDSNVSDDDFKETDFNDSDWQLVSLPHTANIEPEVVNNQWQGVCWYRKTLEVPNFTKSKKVFY